MVLLSQRMDYSSRSLLDNFSWRSLPYLLLAFKTLDRKRECLPVLKWECWKVQPRQTVRLNRLCDLGHMIVRSANLGKRCQGTVAS